MPYIIREYKDNTVVWESSLLEDDHVATKALVHLHKVLSVRVPGIEFKLFKLDEEGELHEIRVIASDSSSASS